jgi:hypothetical protein
VAIARLSGKYESLMWVMHLNSKVLNHFCKVAYISKSNATLGVNKYCILESICVDLLFLWVPDSRFRLWVLVLWLLKLTNFSTEVAGISSLPTKFLWVNKQNVIQVVVLFPGKSKYPHQQCFFLEQKFPLFCPEYWASESQRVF